MSGDERHRALLDARSAALAARGRAQGPSAEHRSFMVCAIGRELYGFPLAATAAVIPERACTPIPGPPPALRGVIAHGGIIVCVIDVAESLGIERDGESAGNGHFVRMRADDPPLAMAVDRVVGLVGVAPDAIEAAPSADGLGAGAISGYAPASTERDGARVAGFAVIDVPRLLRPFLP